MKRIVVLALLVILLVAGFFVYRLTERIGEGKETVDFADPSQRPRVGEMTFQSPQKRFRLADLQGKVVLVDVWATWCSPCIAAIPELVRLQKKYRDDLAVLGLNVDERGWEVVEPFLQRRGDINYPVVRSDPPARILFNTIIDVPPLGKVSALPSSFLIDRQGRLVSKYVGGGTLPQVERDIERLLQE
ncbi:MAG TPA: TlpA disulfide reductase family protein [Acidobacteriota bacterium]|nr:TlpA disulfide reductase family protein [Acidobacteriota bacterium]